MTDETKDETSPQQETEGAPPQGGGTQLTPFMMLCASLGAQVQMALGLIEDPVQKKAIKELPAAKHGIDLLATLEEKTKGNLDDEEEKLLESLLTQLRLLYVEMAKAESTPKPDGEAAS